MHINIVTLHRNIAMLLAKEHPIWLQQEVYVYINVISNG